MKRFHIIVTNFKRIISFIDNFRIMQGFDPEQDSIYIFDSSPESDYRSELMIANRLCVQGLEWGRNMFFVRRRNWGNNLGADLDYLRCLNVGLIESPKYCVFMQDHYLDLKNYVKEDTLPEDIVFDLNRIFNKFEEDETIGCVFYGRYGIRIVTSNPITNAHKEFFGDREDLIPSAVRRSFLIDGSNYVTRPELYMKWFDKHPEYLTKGDGSYGFIIVWEDRIGRILYDQGITWFDMGRNLRFKTIEDVDRIEKRLGRKISKLWYDHRIWYFFYGRDLQFYWPFPYRSFIRYLKIYLANLEKYPRGTTLTFEKP
jgi:hypothetical protein